LPAQLGVQTWHWPPAVQVAPPVQAPQDPPHPSPPHCFPLQFGVQGTLQTPDTQCIPAPHDVSSMQWDPSYPGSRRHPSDPQQYDSLAQHPPAAPLPVQLFDWHPPTQIPAGFPMDL
jgi:hypothetical protein